jgi:hypothetical protein
VGDAGVVVLAHVHNALAPNHSAGMPLAPEGYAALFERAPARLFRDSALLDAALAGDAVDLSRADAPAALADEPALHVVATRRASLFGRLAAPPLDAPGAADLNPLYVADDQGARLRFPTAEYEAEYGVARRYLPERVSLDGAAVARARTGAWDDALRALAARGVLLDLPARYL